MAQDQFSHFHGQGVPQPQQPGRAPNGAMIPRSSTPGDFGTTASFPWANPTSSTSSTSQPNPNMSAVFSGGGGNFHHLATNMLIAQQQQQQQHPHLPPGGQPPTSATTHQPFRPIVPNQGGGFHMQQGGGAASTRSSSHGTAHIPGHSAMMRQNQVGGTLPPAGPVVGTSASASSSFNFRGTMPPAPNPASHFAIPPQQPTASVAPLPATQSNPNAPQLPGTQRVRDVEALLRDSGEDGEDHDPGMGDDATRSLILDKSAIMNTSSNAAESQVAPQPVRPATQEDLEVHVAEVAAEMKREGKGIMERLIAVFGELMRADAERRHEKREELGLPPVQNITIADGNVLAEGNGADGSAPPDSLSLEQKDHSLESGQGELPKADSGGGAAAAGPGIKEEPAAPNKAPATKATTTTISSSRSKSPVKRDAKGGLRQANPNRPVIVHPSVTWLQHEPHEIDKPKSLLKEPWFFEGMHMYFHYPEILAPQRLVMAAVAKAVKFGQHAVLESPTGTGKTAALLCAALSAQRFLSTKYGCHPQIVYGTRTQGQVKQVVTELKKSPYRPAVACLGSRDKVCSNQQVREAPGDMRSKCAKARKVAERPVGSRKANEIACDKFRNMDPVESPFATEIHAESRPVLGDATHSAQKKNLPDIEDLTNLADAYSVCPYFLSQALSVEADLVCPYNYILDPRVRENSKVSIRDRIIILDEAHNIEQVCRDAGSCDIADKAIDARPYAWGKQEFALYVLVEKVAGSLPNYMKFAKGCKICDYGGAMLGGEGEVFSRFGIDKVKNFFVRIHEWMTNLKTHFLEHGNKKNKLLADKEKFGHGRFHQWEVKSYAPYKGVRIRHMLTDLDMGIGKNEEGREYALDPLAVYKTVQTIAKKVATGSKTEDISQQNSALDELQSYLTSFISLCENPESYAASITVSHVEPRFAGAGGGGLMENESQSHPVWEGHLCLYLLYPAVIFERVSEDAHAIILASGTLCPVESFFSELGADFAERQVRGKFLRQVLSPLEAEHVIGPDQLLVQKLDTVGMSLRRFTTEYKHLRPNGQWNELLLFDLGVTLVTIASSVPGGILVFFPSYAMLAKVCTFWQSQAARDSHTGQTVWEALVAAKRAIIQEESKIDIEQLKEDYTGSVRRHGSALLLGVMRAKCSEGISFNDEYCRAVVIVGLAYPNSQAAEVNHKREYNKWWNKGMLALQQQQQRAIAAANQKAAILAAGLRSRGLGGGLPEPPPAPPQVEPTVKNIPISGDAWYSQEAFRSINQALGRCVRHKDDYGALILLDSRWCDAGSKCEFKLAQWLRAIGIQPAVSLAQLTQDLQQHFARNSGKRQRTK